MHSQTLQLFLAGAARVTYTIRELAEQALPDEQKGLDTVIGCQ